MLKIWRPIQIARTMARKRRGQLVHGWVNVDKPLHLTSAAAVCIVRRAFDAQKAGHCGTLDPLATGVLPIALGEATKTVPFVMHGSKGYRFKVQWGEARTTDDREGAVTETSAHRPARSEIVRMIPRFVGEINQVPPRFSAVKIGGRRAYELARSRKEVDIKPRRVIVHALRLVDIVGPDEAVFAVDCGKGTYIRSLARDLAASLGTVGHISCLRRTYCGPFRDCDAIPLEKLARSCHMNSLQYRGSDGMPIDLAACLLPVARALDDIPALIVTKSEAGRIRNGQAIPVLRTDNRQQTKDFPNHANLCALLDGQVIALMRLEGRMAQPMRVLNL